MQNMMTLASISFLVQPLLLHYQVFWSKAARVVAEVTDMELPTSLGDPAQLFTSAISNQANVVHICLSNSNVPMLSFNLCSCMREVD